jgi:hypothetical protein
MQNNEHTHSSAVESYQHQIQSLETKVQDRLTIMQRLVWVRLGLALPGIGFIAFGLLEKTAGSWTWQLGIAMIIAFLVAATIHENNVWATSLLRQRLGGYRRLMARFNRDWASLNPLPTEEICHAFQSELSRDLDVFGDRSLYRWCSLAMTQSGANVLCTWITRWDEHSKIRERQDAVRELASNRTWRRSFFETACNYQQQQTGPEGIVEWARSPEYFLKRTWLHWLTWISPAVFLFGFLCIAVAKFSDNNLGQMIGLGCILGGAAVNFLLTMSIVGPIHDIFVKIGAANRELQSLVNMIRQIKQLDSKGTLLSRVRDDCFNEKHSADSALAGLQRIMALAGMQRSPILFVPYLLLQVGILWDVRILEWLERWKREFGNRTAEWLEAIGTMEALSSAAAIADEYPHWTYPQLLGKQAIVADRLPLLEIEQVSHPLLKDASRVPNSVSISQAKPLLLVTGSNMAGKSTLLRSVGINALLARIGSPVCANSWSSASLDLASSIRVQDSLQDGVSFFMAELKRLRSVVDTAQLQKNVDGRQMLVLLDEILQGTNSRERQIAVEHVLDKLVEYGCIVLTSTHDLEMAGNARIQNIAQVVHFREHFESQDGRQIMRFDYIMYPGVTPTTNALKLLEMVGLRTGE